MHDDLVAPLAEDIHYTYLLIPLIAVAAALKGAWSRAPVTVALAAVAASIYAYLSLPGLRSTAMASYTFYESPVSGSDILLTGAHVYGLACLAVLAVVAIHWQRAQQLGSVPAFPASSVLTDALAPDPVLVPR